MTPTELMDFVRQRYNAVGDNLYAEQEMLDLIYTASMELAKKAYVIERVYTTTTTASTQEYALPTNCFAVKRITYNGNKLQPITFREDDALTLSNSGTLATGTPQYYALFYKTLYLRPIPDDALDLKIFSYNFPQRIDTTSVLEVPTEYQQDLGLFLLSEMHAKEKNYEGAQYYRNLWDVRVKEIVKEQRKARRGDAFTAVQDIDTLPESLLGLI